MANGDSDSGGGLLGGLGKTLSAALPYALPAAMGAVMGGPMGALAGVGVAKGAEAEYQQKEGLKATEWVKLGLQAKQIESTEDLKKAQLESTDAFRTTQLKSMEQWHQMTEADRVEHYKEMILQHKDDHAALDDYRQSQLALHQEGIQMQGMIAGMAAGDRRDRMEDQLRENKMMRVQGASAEAEKASEFALTHRSFWKPLLNKALGSPTATDNMSDEEFQQNVHDMKLRENLSTLGLTRDELLDLGQPPSVVDKIYPPSDSTPSARLTGRGGRAAGASASGASPGRAPKTMWNKKGVVGPDGRRWNIDAFGKPTPAS